MRRAWPLLLVALLATGSAPAAYRGNPADSDPAWSPDGRWIVFVHDPDSGFNGSDRDLVLADSKTGKQRILARGAALGSNRPYGPQWAPGGRTILFGACCDPDEVWTVEIDGSGLKRLAAVGREPVWSPEARRVAFVGERSYLTVMNADGSEQRRLAPAASHPAWSPDGTRIAYAGGGDLYLWLVREERSEPLTRTRRNEDNPRWSPGGALISFTRGFDYYVMRADGSGQRRVARGEQDVPSLSPPDPAVWSPNGEWLALAARTPAGAPVGLTADTIHIVHPDGRGLRRVAPLSHSSQAEPSWSPDGRRIAFVWSPACPGLERWGIAAVQLGRARVRWVTQSCFVYGTSGPDTLEGTADSEILYGFQGDDVLMGRAGEDVLQGGRGDDRLDGGRTYDDICDEWCDVLRGGPGDDRLVAHDTPGYLDGGLGRDRLSGGSRWDFIDPGRGSDVVRAGRADDVVHARDGSMDRIACGGGRDAVAADPLDYVAADCEYVRRR